MQPYGNTQPQYGNPQPQYGNPQPQYGNPLPQYGNPQPQYGQSYPNGGYNPYSQPPPPPQGAYPAYPQPGQGYPMMASGYNAPPPPPPNDMPAVMVMQPMGMGMGEVKQQELVIYTEKVNNKYPTTANNVPHPAQIYCTICSRNVTTLVTDKAGSGTWTWCLILSCFTPLCCCIPFCVSSCQDKIHTCPSCQNQVGYYEYKVF